MDAIEIFISANTVLLNIVRKIKDGQWAMPVPAEMSWQPVPRPPLFPPLADLTFHSLSGLLSTICLLDLPHLAKPAFKPSPDSNAERRRPACRIA